MLKIIIILLFLEICIIPLAISEQTIGKNIITVDDEPGDADYTSIKEALNHSNPGDIIEVYSGTYYERLINISIEAITLRGIAYELGNGTDTGRPFINGEGLFVIISVFAQNVTISGFYMENRGEFATVIVEIRKNAFSCTLSDNSFNYSTMACIQCEASNCKILNNIISHSSIRQGILICEPGSNNTVSGNVISDCEYGIEVWTPGTNNVFEGNRISKCRSIGLNIIGSDDNTVYYNSFEENPLGLFLYSSVGNKIEKNNFINNTQHAYFNWLEFPFRSKWIRNYWGEPRLLPYLIIGRVYFIPWVNFDRRPAQEPYDIPGMT